MEVKEIAGASLDAHGDSQAIKSGLRRPPNARRNQAYRAFEGTTWRMPPQGLECRRCCPG